MVKATLIGMPEKVDYNRLGFELEGTRKPGQTGIYRNALWPDLVTVDNQPLRTLQDLWQSGMEYGANLPCLGHRPFIKGSSPPRWSTKYSWLTYGQVDARRLALGAALQHNFLTGKLRPTEDGLETVGLWSSNRPEWQIVDLACQAYNKVSVSLYDTLGPDAVQYISNHASLSVIFCTADKITELLKIAGKLDALKLIVSIDPLEAKVRDLLTTWATTHNVELATMAELELFGSQHPLPMVTATPKSIATICYTSGTTGNPKGALLTHGNLTTAVVSNLYAGHDVPGGPLLSYLPLAHIYARFCEQMALAMGHPVGYYSGDHGPRLLEDAQCLKPVYFPSVPRVLNKIYAGANAALQAGGFRASMLQRAINAKMARFKETGSRDYLLWDKLVFRKIRALLGSHIQVISSGSAPIAGDVLDFLKIAFGHEVLEGYGMTENCGTCSRNYADDMNSAGTVGPPQPCNEVKLIDVPEMGYTSNDKPYPRGEICTRGGNNFIGYYKDPENTAKTLDSEGWVHTGDVAAIDYAGRIAIIDRVKNIMKLSQGEYVALEKIENTYSTVSVLQTVFVYGDSLRDYLVGVGVPEPIALTELAFKLGVTPNKVDPTDAVALDTIIASPAIKTEIFKQMEIEASKAKLRGFERVKKLHLTNHLFTAQNELVTATFKIKRKNAYEFFKRELEAMYSAGL